MLSVESNFVYKYSVKVGHYFWLFGKHVQDKLFMTNAGKLRSQTLMWHIKKHRFLHGPPLRHGLVNTNITANPFCAFSLNATVVMFVGFQLFDDTTVYGLKGSAVFDFKKQAWIDYPNITYTFWFASCQGVVSFDKLGHKVAFVHVLESLNGGNFITNLSGSIHTYDLKFGTKGTWKKNLTGFSPSPSSK